MALVIRPTIEELEATLSEYVNFHGASPAVLDALTDLAARVREAEEALTRIAEQQPKTLAMIRSNGFVFDSIGREPGNWKHLAFSIYCDLCEVEGIARNALEEAKHGL